VAEGRIAAVETGPFLLRGWSFAVRAPAAAWVRFWEPVLAPGYHDLFAMKKLGVARVEGDLRDRVGRIDTARCPLYLMTGEYDFSCTPDDTRATAEAVAGARLIIMKELGHFPMSEHPERFRGYLLPVLDDIRGGRP
jgi:pimeloyl-ACP methyl ester carboxylesterase